MHYTLPIVFASRQPGLPYGPAHAKYKVKVSRRAGSEFFSTDSRAPNYGHNCHSGKVRHEQKHCQRNRDIKTGPWPASGPNQLPQRVGDHPLAVILTSHRICSIGKRSFAHGRLVSHLFRRSPAANATPDCCRVRNYRRSAAAGCNHKLFAWGSHRHHSILLRQAIIERLPHRIRDRNISRYRSSLNIPEHHILTRATTGTTLRQQTAAGYGSCAIWHCRFIGLIQLSISQPYRSGSTACMHSPLHTAAHICRSWSSTWGSMLWQCLVRTTPGANSSA